MTASREIPHVRLGRCVRYPVDDLQRWINEQKKGVGGMIWQRLFPSWRRNERGRRIPRRMAGPFCFRVT